MKRTLWTERTFSTDLPPGLMVAILERLRGTVVRLYQMTASLSDEEATHQPGNKWSIKEHIGHLADLEDLHLGRVDDFKAGKDVLRAADMSNEQTYAAHHNSKMVKELIAGFAAKREQLVAGFAHLDDEIQQRQSLHPRLKVMMRPVDNAFFVAEHDDHHLATIRENFASKRYP